jgi:dTDP-4-amino-4,6-dideoxygalactose transaminase
VAWAGAKATSPLAEEYYAHCLSIPFLTLTDEEQAYVVACIEEFLSVEG